MRCWNGNVILTVLQRWDFDVETAPEDGTIDVYTHSSGRRSVTIISIVNLKQSDASSSGGYDEPALKSTSHWNTIQIDHRKWLLSFWFHLSILPSNAHGGFLPPMSDAREHHVTCAVGRRARSRRLVAERGHLLGRSFGHRWGCWKHDCITFLFTMRLTCRPERRPNR